MSQDEKCPEDELLALLGDPDALAPSEEQELRAHLETCAACREAVEANRHAASTLRALPAPRPSQEARDRAYAAVLEAMERPRAEAQPRTEARPRAASAPRVAAARTESAGKLGSGKLGPAKLDPAKLAAARPAEPVRRGGFRVLMGSLAAAACLFLVAGVFMTSNREASAPVGSLSRAPGESRSTKAIDDHITKRIDQDSPTAAAAPAPAREPVPASPPRDAAGALDRAEAGKALLEPLASAEKKAGDGKDGADKSAASFGETERADEEGGRQVRLRTLAAGRVRGLERAHRVLFIDERAELEKSNTARRSASKPQSAGGVVKDESPAAPGEKADLGPDNTDKKKEAKKDAPQDPAPGGDQPRVGAKGGSPPAKPAPDADTARANTNSAEKPELPAKAPVPAPAQAKSKPQLAGEAGLLFADPGSTTRQLLVLADGGAFWVPTESGQALAAETTRNALKSGDAVEGELLLRILDEQLAREPQESDFAKKTEWARRTVALERALAAQGVSVK